MTMPPADTATLRLLEEFASDWGLDDARITAETWLKVDLGFESADLMQLFSALREEYPGLPLPFQDLVLRNGRFVPDLQVAEIIAFVSDALERALSGVGREAAE